MCHLCDRNRGEGGAGGSSVLLSTEMVGISPEPEPPIHTVLLRHYLGHLGVICCILAHLLVLGEPTCQSTAYNTKSNPQEPFQIKANWGDNSLNPLQSQRTLFPQSHGERSWHIPLEAAHMAMMGMGWGGECCNPNCNENGKSEMERKKDKTFLRTLGTANGGK